MLVSLLRRLVSGSYWVIHTGTVTELLLNAVALEFILDVGELVTSAGFGSYWLVHTGTVTELLLTAVALEFILNDWWTCYFCWFRAHRG